MDVLVVDDEFDIRATLAELLRGEGYDVGELSSAQNLVTVLASEAPRLVLLDLTMPGFDPDETLAAVHAQGLSRRSTIVALTGVDGAEGIARRLGLAGVLPKPFELDALLDTVAHYCREPAAGRDVPHAPM